MAAPGIITAPPQTLLGLANAWTQKQTITPAANDNALVVSGFSLTGANAQSLISLAGTWNTSGTPTGIDLNIVNTASNAASLLFNLRVGGTSQFNVGVNGIAVAAASVRVNTSISLGVATGNDISVAAAGSYGWGSTTALTTNDVQLFRNAAGILAQRVGANAQASYLYNIYTDASNGEWLALDWKSSSNIAIIGTKANGTGTVRPLQLKFLPQTVASLPSASTAGSGARMFVSDALAPAFGSTVAGSGTVTVPVFSDGINWKVG